jgi:hypothetical protein
VRRLRFTVPVVAALVLLGTTAALVSGGEESTGDAADQFTAAGADALPAGEVPAGAVDGTAGTAATAPGGQRGGATAGSGGGGRTAGPGGAVAVARSGQRCTAGARQVAWSDYAPPCTGAFGGSNGGATSHGVTGDTIKLTYRRQNASQAAAIRAIAGEAVPIDAQYEHDLQVYMRLFSSQFELYGRKLQLVPYSGEGDYLQEDLGNGQAQANSDGVRARELGGFADLTFPSATSLFYSAALQSQGVIAYGFPVNPQRWYERNSPWQYNTFMSGTAWAAWATNLVCQRMAGETAAFAGDAAFQQRQRVFGLVAVEFPTWLEVADEIAASIEGRCGVKMARRASYAEDLSTMQQDANSMAAQMQSAGVTTVICFCDPLMPIFITDAAERQQYRPEWVVQNQFDPIAQGTNQSQFAHAIAQGPPQTQRGVTEAYRAYKLADPNGEPASIYYAVAYETVLHLASGIQLAGPDLNPQSFRRGVFSIPTGNGQFGLWSGGDGRYTPVVGIGVVWWNPRARSANGKAGAWVECEGGTIFPFGNPAAWGDGQPRCFQ